MRLVALVSCLRPAVEEGLPEVERPSEGIMAEDRALASFNFLDEEDSDDEEGGEWEDQTTQVRVCLPVCMRGGAYKDDVILSLE